MIRGIALMLTATLGCGLVVWFGVALAMEIVDAESETKHYMG